MKFRIQNIDIVFTDIKQCFDSLWLDEVINDIYTSGVQNRHLNLLYSGNKRTSMCIDTNFGRSDREELYNVVMQGSVTGGILCSNQISKFCNRLYAEGDAYVMYLDKIPIPPLAMVDDIVSITKCCNTEAIEMNTKTDEFIRTKKLEGQTGSGKCQWIHIGKEKCCNSYTIGRTPLDQAKNYRYQMVGMNYMITD